MPMLHHSSNAERAQPYTYDAVRLGRAPCAFLAVSSSLLLRPAQLVLGKEPLVETGIAQIDFDYQIAAAAHARGKRQVMLAIANLLMRDFEALAMCKDSAQGEDGSLAKRGPQGIACLMGRYNNKGQMSDTHAQAPFANKVRPSSDETLAAKRGALAAHAADVDVLSAHFNSTARTS